MKIVALISLRNLFADTSPRTAGDFVFSEQYGRHLLHGGALSIDEFNAFVRSREWDRLIERHGERVSIELVTVPEPEPLETTTTEGTQSQGGETVITGGSLPPEAGSTPAPATTSAPVTTLGDLVARAMLEGKPPARASKKKGKTKKKAKRAK